MPNIESMSKSIFRLCTTTNACQPTEWSYQWCRRWHNEILRKSSAVNKISNRWNDNRWLNGHRAYTRTPDEIHIFIYCVHSLQYTIRCREIFNSPIERRLSTRNVFDLFDVKCCNPPIIHWSTWRWHHVEEAFHDQKSHTTTQEVQTKKNRNTTNLFTFPFWLIKNMLQSFWDC